MEKVTLFEASVRKQKYRNHVGYGIFSSSALSHSKSRSV